MLTNSIRVAASTAVSCALCLSVYVACDSKAEPHSAPATSSASAQYTGGAATPEALRLAVTEAALSRDWPALARVTVPEERAALAGRIVSVTLGVRPEAIDEFARMLNGLAGADVPHPELEALKHDRNQLERMLEAAGGSLELLDAALASSDVTTLQRWFPEPEATIDLVMTISAGTMTSVALPYGDLVPDAPLREVQPDAVHAPVFGGDGYGVFVKRHERWYVRLVEWKRSSRLEEARATLKKRGEEAMQEVSRAATGKWRSPWGALSFVDKSNVSLSYPWQVRTGVDGQPEFEPGQTPNTKTGRLDLSRPYHLGLSERRDATQNGAMYTYWFGAYVDAQGFLHVGSGSPSPITQDRVAFIRYGLHELQVAGDTCRLEKTGMHEPERPRYVPCRFIEGTPPRFEVELPEGVGGMNEERFVYLEPEGLLVSDSLWLGVYHRVNGAH